MLSLPKPFPIQSLLYKTTTCLTQSATNSFVPQKEKKLSKTTTEKLYPAKKWEAMHKKYMSLRLYLLYCYPIMQSLFNVYKNWIFTFKIGLPNYPRLVLVLDSQSRVPDSNLQVALRSRLFQPFILPKLIK